MGVGGSEWEWLGVGRSGWEWVKVERNGWKWVVVGRSMVYYNPFPITVALFDWNLYLISLVLRGVCKNSSKSSKVL